MIKILWLAEINKDISYALRSWSKSAVSALSAMLVLAVAIGVTTALFSVVKAVLLVSLPFADPDRLVVLWETRPVTRENSPVLPGNLAFWKNSTGTFSELAGIRKRKLVLTQSAEPAELDAEAVSPTLFHLLGIHPVLGAGFASGDDAPGRSQVVLLSSELWRERFSQDPGILGKAITLDNRVYSVVGVMPEQQVWLGRKPALWIPLTLDDTPVRYLTVLGRLNPGVPLSAARTEFNRLSRALAESRPDLNHGWEVSLVPLSQQLLGNVRTPLIALFASVVLVLLIACVNVANICLARIATRQKEIAVRSALGASSWRVIRLALVESLVLSATASLLGIVLAFCLLRLFLKLAPPDIPRIHDTHLDWAVLIFALALALITGLFVGILPALRAAQVDGNSALKGTSARPVTFLRLRVTDFLVTVEVALAMVLLAGAGLMIQGLRQMQTQKLGFDPHPVLAMSVNIRQTQYQNTSAMVGYYQKIIRELQTIPGVSAVGITSALPAIDSVISEVGIAIVGYPAPTGQERHGALRIIDGDYFKTMSMPLISGRYFNEMEMKEDRHAIVINESMARQYFGNADPIGKILLEGGMGGVSRRIVGVVADVQSADLNAAPSPMMYEPLVQYPFPAMIVVVRTAEAEPLSFVRSCVERIHAVNPDQPVSQIMSMDQGLAERISRPRFNTFLLSAFSAVALLFAAVGIYGVVAYNVSKSYRNIGICFAVGASRLNVIAAIFKQQLISVAWGVAVGTVFSEFSTKIVSSLLAHTITYPILLLLTMVVLFLAVASLASLLPLIRILKVDPLVILRTE